MAYPLIPDELPDDPRYVDLDLEHFGLLVCARCYMARHLTDGIIPGAMLRRFGAGNGVQAAARLVELGIWREVVGGYADLHFLEHNYSREEVEAKRSLVSEARRRAGEKGGRASGAARRASSEASGKQVASDGPKQDEAAVEAQSDPILSNPIQSGGEIAPAGALALTAEPTTTARVPAKRRASQHTGEVVAAKDKVVEAFVEAFTTAKGVPPTLENKGDHAAAFALAKAFGVEEGSAIIRRAMSDPWVLEHAPTLRHIASKPDAWRGTAPARGRAGREQQRADGSEAWLDEHR